MDMTTLPLTCTAEQADGLCRAAAAAFAAHLAGLLARHRLARHRVAIERRCGAVTLTVDGSAPSERNLHRSRAAVARLLCELEATVAAPEHAGWMALLAGRHLTGTPAPHAPGCCQMAPPALSAGLARRRLPCQACAASDNESP